MLAGHRFESRCGIGSADYKYLQHIPKEEYGRRSGNGWIGVEGVWRQTGHTLKVLEYISKILKFQAVLKRPPYSTKLKS
jgi:hypothetical protein